MGARVVNGERTHDPDGDERDVPLVHHGRRGWYRAKEMSTTAPELVGDHGRFVLYRCPEERLQCFEQVRVSRWRPREGRSANYVRVFWTQTNASVRPIWRRAPISSTRCALYHRRRSSRPWCW